MYKIIKRILDFLVSLFAIVVLSPVLAITSIAVKADSKGPVFFVQKRIGKDKKHFNMYKFRSMRTDTPHDMPTHLLNNPDAFITKVGKFLRKSSLDELPQLFNILKGDMSIVGPRPLLVEYLPRYNEFQARRHEVRPGLTGYAQVNGRNSISWEERFELDVRYVDNISFLGDIKIILNTVTAVLKRDGISSETSATMEVFMGTQKEVS